MKRLHLVLGVIGVVGFVVTGSYMLWFREPAMHTLDGFTRMLYRSRHIALLLSSLHNLSLGTYLRPADGLWRRRFQAAGSCAILAAPPLLFVAFFTEALRTDLGGPFSKPAIAGMVIGSLCHAFAGRQTRP